MIRQVTVVLQIEVEDSRHQAFGGCAQQQVLIIVPDVAGVIAAVPSPAHAGNLQPGEPNWRQRVFTWGRRVLHALWRFGPILLRACS